MLFRKRKRSGIRFKRLRLLSDDLLSILKGWYFRFASPQPVPHEYYKNWQAVSEFSTNIRWRPELKEINQNRFDNMKLSCNMLNGIRLKKGEVFSMRRVIGEPTVERGFKDGPMLVGGELGFTSGGGLCQVSTTLFNAALAANLKILRKHNHSWDIWGSKRFIDLGRDAVYTYVRHDLKFKNNLGSEIVIIMKVDEPLRTMECRVLSCHKPEFTVNINSEVLKEIKPPHSEIDNKGKEYEYISGWLVRTRRYVASETAGTRLTYDRKEMYKPVIKRRSS